jgi:hypothetical protein
LKGLVEVPKRAIMRTERQEVSDMKMEVIEVKPTEQRVLLLFDGDGPTSESEQVDEYLRANDLEPKRKYSEVRDGKEYMVYYFGQCYLEGHLDQLSALADDAGSQA